MREVLKPPEVVAQSIAERAGGRLANGVMELFALLVVVSLAMPFPARAVVCFMRPPPFGTLLASLLFTRMDGGNQPARATAKLQCRQRILCGHHSCLWVLLTDSGALSAIFSSATISRGFGKCGSG